MHPPAPDGTWWRETKPADADGLRALAGACGCSPADARTVGKWMPRTAGAETALVLIGAGGQVRGALRVRSLAPRGTELPSQFEWLVHPETSSEAFTGHLVRWFEDAAEEHLRDRQSDPTCETRLATHADCEELGHVLAACGYTRALVEDRMRRGVTGRLAGRSRAKHTYARTAWSAGVAPLFFDTYVRSFRERPGFPGWPRETWVQAFTGYEGFRPDLSALLRIGDEPVAFLLAAEDGEDRAACWIVQLGVVPAHRGRGIGTLLLQDIRERAEREGLGALMLSVGADNARARGLYERNGFVRVGRTTVYRRG